MALRDWKIRERGIVRGYLQGAALARRIVACATVLIAASIAAAGLFGAAQPAAAQQGFGNYFGYQAHKRHRRRAVRRSRQSSSKHTAEKKKEAKQATKPSGPVYIVVSLGDQHISVYDRTGRIARSTISTGRAGHRTPAGVFSVIGKERYHYSNLYGAAPMPWMQRITWSGVAMHAGYVTGRPASHGCIRLPYSFAPKLWKMTKMGARVVVARKDTIPFDISHAFLPSPTMRPPPGTQEASRAPQSRIELASMGTPSSVAMTTSDPSEGTGNELLNPIAYAAALKKRAKADKKAADQAAKEALAAAQAAGAEARQAVADIEKAKADLEAAKAKLAVLEGAPSAPLRAETASTGSAAAAKAALLETARIAARSELIRARAAFDEAQRREAVKTPAAFAAVQAYKAAATASKEAAKTLKEADRRREPVSVFISKKEGRVFIRQDWKPVYEAPVTIRDPDRPLGTHLYIAVAAEPDGSAMQWQAISVPPEPTKSQHSSKSSRKQSKDTPALPVAKDDTSGPETAAGALDRIEMSDEARQRISELLWTGASLIVSDHPRSYEMDDDTDFIVLTR